MLTTGHRVLITGGSRGIGFALATQFHAAGNHVVLVGRDEGTLLQAAKALPGAEVHRADVGLASARSEIVRRFSDIDILINNAGIQLNGDFSEMPLEQVEAELSINLLAPILLTHEFLPYLKRRPTSAIVNVSSVLALVPKQSASVYCATKAAMHSFNRSLRWQLEATNVKVFEIVPPLVDTAMTAGRGKGKLSPAALAEEFWSGFKADRLEMHIGKAKAAALLARVLPFVAERVVRRG